MTWVRKEKGVTCKWCEKPIEAATPMVVVFWWNKGNPEKRGWNVKRYYHPECWILQGLDYLEMNPYIPHKRGPKPKLSEEDARTRYLLVRRYHALQQRKQKLKADYPDKLLLEVKIDKQVTEIMMDISQVGGVPKSWIEKL